MKSGVGAGSLDRLPVVLELDDATALTVALLLDLGPSSYETNKQEGGWSDLG